MSDLAEAYISVEITIVVVIIIIIMKKKTIMVI